MLSMPFVLLADAMQTPTGACNRYCCLPHGRHAAPMQGAAGSKNASMSAKSESGMSCHHSASQGPTKCTMRSGLRIVDFAGIAPLPPTRPALLISAAAPSASRGATQNFETSLPTGFFALPFQPPRA